MALGEADTGRTGQEREVALAELEAGIAFWRSKAAAGWPPDFHNSEYRLWAAEPRDFSDDWWIPFRRRLHDWIALRPATYEQVTTRFVERREALIRAWASHSAPYGESDITTVMWE